jgi:hypothetical protein
MKRAKFMLAAIAVLAIAGGVYASKARTGDIVFVRSNATINSCDLAVQPATFATTGAFKSFTYATLVEGPCTIKTSYYVGE